MLPIFFGNYSPGSVKHLWRVLKDVECFIINFLHLLRTDKWMDEIFFLLEF